MAYKLPRGRPANPICPVCRATNDPEPQKRIAPGRKCRRHENEYMGNAVKKSQQKRGLERRRDNLLLNLYQNVTIKEFEEAESNFDELLVVEQALREDHNIYTFPNGDPKLIEFRRWYQRTFRPPTDLEVDAAQRVFEAAKQDDLLPPTMKVSTQIAKTNNLTDEELEDFAVLRKAWGLDKNDPKSTS